MTDHLTSIHLPSSLALSAIVNCDQCDDPGKPVTLDAPDGKWCSERCQSAFRVSEYRLLRHLRGAA